MRIDLPCCGFKNCRHNFDGNCMSPSKQEKCEYWYLMHKELPSVEPDINAIKIAQEEAWKFANNISKRMSIGQREACFGHGLISNVLNALTYQEAKDKYEAYEKKAVLKIQLYDELLNDDGNKGVVVGENDDYYTVLWWNGSCGILYKNSDDFKKSGKRHPEIADLLKQLRK